MNILLVNAWIDHLASGELRLIKASASIDVFLKSVYKHKRTSQTVTTVRETGPVSRPSITVESKKEVMMMAHPARSRFAVITGASRGIGAGYARALGQQGYSLLLVARDKQRLRTVAEEIRATQTVTVATECMDLSMVGAAHQLLVATRDHSSRVDLLINNAGFGMYGDFATMPLPRIQEMLQLHITTIVESTRLFLPMMLDRRSGAIVNVASVAGFFPIPYMTEYAASKAFLISFSEALVEEVRGSGVVIQACCPGFTKTDFHETAGHQPRNPLQAQSVDEVVRASLRGLDRHHSRVTVGWQGWLSDMVTRYLPRSLLIRIAGRQAKPPARHR